MKVLLLTIAALTGASAIAATAMAEDTAPGALPTVAPASATPAASKKDPNARICKTTPVIGSRVPTRVCMTRGEWEQRARDARQEVQDSQRGGLASCGTNPCT